jgi:epoxyqueuosine reductase
MDAAQRTAWIVERAKRIGFDLCGVASAEEASENSAQLAEWLARGHAGEMKYLHDPRRQSISAAMPSARSVVVCAMNYHTAQPYSTEAAAQNAAGHASDGRDAPRGWISRYAWGDDYHIVLGEKLDMLSAAMHEQFGAKCGDGFEARWYVDTGPVMERAAAQRAGLGWLAKNTLLINSKLGSWLFLGVILTSLQLAPTATNEMPADLCGQCTRCIDACPTGAITEPYLLDARRCISYLTIELRGAIPEELREPMGQHVFGCDICQDVCPWNGRAPVTQEPAFQPREGFVTPELEHIASLSESEFREMTRNSPLKRAKWRGLVRNACVALGNAKLRPGSETQRRVTELLSRLTQSGDALIAEHASDALRRLALNKS